MEKIDPKGIWYINLDGNYEGKKYKYVINIVRDFDAGQQYINHVNVIDSQVSSFTKGRVRVTT